MSDVFDLTLRYVKTEFLTRVVYRASRDIIRIYPSHVFICRPCNSDLDKLFDLLSEIKLITVSLYKFLRFNRRVSSTEPVTEFAVEPLNRSP